MWEKMEKVKMFVSENITRWTLTMVVDEMVEELLVVLTEDDL